MLKAWNEIAASRLRGTLLLTALVAVLYGGAGEAPFHSLGFPFHYDDRHAVVDNPHIRSLDALGRFFVDPALFSADPSIAMYRPLVLAGLAINHAWDGLDPAAFRLSNIALHAVAVLLLRAVLAAVGIGPAVALAAACLFAAHPLASEPVNYISSRSETQAACGVLAAFGLYVVWRSRGGTGYLAGALAAMALGLLSKSTAVVLPGLLLLFELGRGKRFDWRGPLPFALLAVAYVGLLYAVGFLGAGGGEAPRGLAAQWATQTKALIYYVHLLCMPVGLSIDHPFVEGHWGQAQVWAAAAVLLSAVPLWWRCRKTAPLVFIGLGWMVVSLGPTLAVPLNVLVNEHRLYLPAAGGALALAAWLERNPLARGRGGLLAAVLLGAVALLTWERNAVWSDGYALWADAAGRGTERVRPRMYMAHYAKDAGRLDEAEGHYRQVLAWQPDHVAAAHNLANLLRTAGRNQEAAALYEDLLRRHPELEEARYNLGNIYLDAGQNAAARALYAEIQGRHLSLALNNIGSLFQREGRIDSAAAYFAAAVDTPFPAPEARQNLERLRAGLSAWAPPLLEGGGAFQVESVCRLLLDRQPDEPQALFFLAVALFKQERLAESIQVNRRLTSSRPDDYFAMMQLANALEAAGRYREAAQTYSQVLQRRADPTASQRLEALRQRTGSE